MGDKPIYFFDNWLPNGALAQRLHVNPSIWCNELTVRQWTNENGRWNILLSFRRRFPFITNEIIGMSVSNSPDKFIWKLVVSGNFSIASYYESIRKRNPKVAWHRLVWKGKILEKCKFIT